MSFFKRIFLGEKASNAIAESVKTGMTLIDEAFDTDDEKRQAKMELVKTLINARQVTANDGNSEARFWFLQQITNFVFMLCAATIITELTGRADISKTLLEVADKFYLGWAFFSAVSFYFLVDVTNAAGFKLPTLGKK